MHTMCLPSRVWHVHGINMYAGALLGHLPPDEAPLQALAAAAEVWPLVVASQPLNTLAFSVDGLLYGKPDPNPDPHPHPDPNPNPNPNQARATSTTARS